MPLQAARASLACEIGEGNLSLTYSSLPEKLAEKSSEHPLCQVKTPPELRFHPFFVCLGEWNKRVGPVKLNAIEFTISLGPDAKKKLHHSFCQIRVPSGKTATVACVAGSNCRLIIIVTDTN